MTTLHELLVEELKDLYSAEKQIVKALPKMIKGVTTPALRDGLSSHLQVTKEQVLRLEAAFGALGVKPKAKHCKGMEGLLAEGAECLEEEDPGSLRDLQIIGAAQRVEHYEVAAYGTSRAMAEQCGHSEVVDLLAATLAEEEQADSELSQVASAIYSELAGQHDEEEDDEEPAPPAPAMKRTAPPPAKKTAKKAAAPKKAPARSR